LPTYDKIHPFRDADPMTIRNYYDDEYEAFRTAFRTFPEREAAPNRDQDRAAGMVSRDLDKKTENQRFLRSWIAAKHGNLGLTDFRCDQVMMEEVGRSLESCLWTGALDRNSPPYIANYGSEATKGHYLPKLASGEMICGIAMTEPDAGSDIAGSKTRAEQRADGSCVLRMQSENKHLSEEQARHLTIHGVNRNEDGSFSWKFDNYLRSSPPLDITDAELHALWGRITCPTLLAYGKDSLASNPAEDGRAAHFTTARVINYDDAGHRLHHDQFDRFLADLIAFL
jgi:hypothetical protein